MKLKFSKSEKKLIDFFYNLELNRKSKIIKCPNKDILPKHILNRRIRIITNGEVIFDSSNCKNNNIPISIQYAIKQYGYPAAITRCNKTPLTYNITSKVSSFFPSVEEHNLYMNQM